MDTTIEYQAKNIRKAIRDLTWVVDSLEKTFPPINPPVHAIRMMGTDGKHHWREYDHEPTDEESSQLAMDLGWPKGVVFPDFDNYHMDEQGNMLTTGGGGGENSGNVGEPVF